MNGLTFIAVATAAIAAFSWELPWLAAIFLGLAFFFELALAGQRAAALAEAEKVPEHEKVIE